MATTAQIAIAVIGIDIGKNSFHVGLDGRGAMVPRQKRSRGQVEHVSPICPRTSPASAAHRAPTP